MARRPSPVRTCVGCRKRTMQAALLRVVVVEDHLVPDADRHLPGRGASVHPDLRCLDLAEKRRAFPRALRLTGPLDLSAVRTALMDRMDSITPHDHHAATPPESRSSMSPR